MRRFILLIIALATLLPSVALGYDVLVLQSRRDPLYDEVMKGYRFEQKSSLRLLVLSDYAEVDLIRVVREDRPRLILALGDAALKEARNIKDIPVLALLTVGIYSQSGSLQPNLSAISMLAEPESYMSMFRNMKTHRVGIVCNPAKNGWYLAQARRAAQEAGVELVVRAVSKSADTPEQLESLTGKVDALWMLPDPSALTRNTAELYFKFGQKNNVPVVSFSANYLALGAAAALDLDRFALGRQADQLATELLSGQAVRQQIVYPAKNMLKTNAKLLKRLQEYPASHAR
jgi:putative tryptophan/tyrosine transport system substrate-binding protein